MNEKIDLVYVAKEIFSTETYKLYSYLMYDGLEYIELSQYNSDILNTFEIENVLTFTKINCIDNSDGFDNFLNEQIIKLEMSNLTEINLNKTTKITTATLNDLQSIKIGASKINKKKIMNSHF